MFFELIRNGIFWFIKQETRGTSALGFDFQILVRIKHDFIEPFDKGTDIMFVFFNCHGKINLVKVVEIVFVMMDIQVIPTEDIDFVVVETNTG
jgi:hypothetical protein